METRFVGDNERTGRILKSSHVDAIGHMGMKRTLSSISERFIWPGIVKEVKDMVSHLRFLIIQFY